MKPHHLLLLAGLLLATPLAQAAPPAVSNVRAAQRAGSNLVDIYYDLSGGTPPLSVTVAVSSDNGATYAVPASSLTGHVGANVAAGSNRRITWNAGADWANQFSAGMKVRVTASDVPPAPAGMTHTDAVGDIYSGISSGGGTLDIVSMEVKESAQDIIFRLIVNGDVRNPDWGKFTIGIANMKSSGATNELGNAWNRPIRLLASPTNGMTHWIGSWVNGGGGSQLWTYNGSSWNGPSSLISYSFSAGGNGTSTIQYTASKASLGIGLGDTIFFDAYSTGNADVIVPWLGRPYNDSAVDSLANPRTSISNWEQPYTSSASTGILQYTISIPSH